jgi:anti-sigma regulatory factor (Ser/Thr protein kinase)
MDTKPTWTRLCSVEPKAAEVSTGRRCIGDVPSVPDEVRERAELIVSELVTNEIVHGNVPVDTRIDVTVLRFADRLRIEVAHPGPADGFEPHVRDATPLDDIGRGLLIVEAVASRWGVLRDAEAGVWAELDL